MISAPCGAPSSCTVRAATRRVLIIPKSPRAAHRAHEARFHKNDNLENRGPARRTTPSENLSGGCELVGPVSNRPVITLHRAADGGRGSPSDTVAGPTNGFMRNGFRSIFSIRIFYTRRRFSYPNNFNRNRLRVPDVGSNEGQKECIFLALRWSPTWCRARRTAGGHGSEPVVLAAKEPAAAAAPQLALICRLSQAVDASSRRASAMRSQRQTTEVKQRSVIERLWIYVLFKAHETISLRSLLQVII